jgi:hypothetical protein
MARVKRKLGDEKMSRMANSSQLVTYYHQRFHPPGEGLSWERQSPDWRLRRWERPRQSGDWRSCDYNYMNSISESLRPPVTSTGRAAKGNCVAARRGGEQPAAELRSQTKVNQIRLRKSASLRTKGEARRVSGILSVPLPSSMGWGRAFRGGCGENAVKGSCVSNDTCLIRNGLDPVQAGVRAAIVALKRGNSRGAKGGRKVEGPKP